MTNGATQPWGSIAGRRSVWPSPAQELLLRAALLPDERAIGAWSEVRPSVDLERLDATTTALLPILRRNLVALEVDDSLLAVFKGVHRHNWARNQLLLAPLLPVVAALETAGIPTALLKGAAFLADARLDAGLRAMNDVDVLVPTSCRAAAIDLLLEHGLVPVDGAAPWYVVDYVPDYSPGYGFRDQLDRQLDLHWHVLHAACQPGADDPFWAAAIPVELAGVSTRALCPADELLHVVLHGLRWDPSPAYRWVVDAALLTRGTFGPVDYDRLIEQARRVRATVALHAGLSYLRHVADAPIPGEVWSALRRSRSSLMERFELRAQMTQPRARRRLHRTAVHHEQYVRRRLPVGTRPTMRRRAGLELQRLGIEGVRDVWHTRSGGVPGAGRPTSSVAAPVGTGHPDEAAAPVAAGTSLAFWDHAVVRSYVAYGTWRAEPEGCWMAGREARLVLPLALPVPTMLAIDVTAAAFEAVPGTATVLVNGEDAGPLALRDGQGVVVVPCRLIGHRARLDLVLHVPRAVSPAAAGVGDDDRPLGLRLQEIGLRVPPCVALGERIAFGAAANDRALLLGGWSFPEPHGRWTEGPRAGLFLRVEQHPACAVEAHFDASSFVDASGRGRRVEVFASGRRIGVLVRGGRGEAQAQPVRIPRDCFGPAGDLALELRIARPRSPHAEGLSEDRRALGLHVEGLTLQTAS